MDAEARLTQEASQGYEADRLKDFPSWKRAIAHAEAELIRQLKSVGIKDKDLQADMVRALQLIETLVRFVEQESDTGKMARLELSKPNVVKRMFAR